MSESELKVPTGWIRCCLKDISCIKSGSTPLRSKHEKYYVHGNIPWVKTMDLNNGKVKFTDEKITDLALEETSCPLLGPGTILIAMYGGYKQIGRTGMMTFTGSINQALSALILDKDKASPEFVLQWLNSNVLLWKKYAASSRKDPNITKKDVENFPIILPPISEQTIIAEILTTWDDAIDLTERLIEKLQERKKGLMQQLLFVDENCLLPARRLPDFSGKWKMVNLHDRFQRITRKNKVGCTNVLTASAQLGLVSQLEYYNRNVAGESLAGYYLIKKGEFAYNRGRSTGYPYGATKRLERYSEGVLSILYVCFRIKSDEMDSGDFFTHYFESGILNRGLYKITQEGARNHGLLNISVADFFDLKILVPELDEQKALAEFFNLIDREIELTQEKLQLLRQQKKGLMQRLLTGEVRVRA